MRRGLGSWGWALGRKTSEALAMHPAPLRSRLGNTRTKTGTFSAANVS